MSCNNEMGISPHLLSLYQHKMLKSWFREIYIFFGYFIVLKMKNENSDCRIYESYCHLLLIIFVFETFVRVLVLSSTRKCQLFKVILSIWFVTSVSHPGFFLKIFDGGGLKIFGPRRSPTGTKSDGGGDLWKKSDWSQKCLLNAKLGHFLLF